MKIHNKRAFVILLRLKIQLINVRRVDKEHVVVVNLDLARHCGAAAVEVRGTSHAQRSAGGFMSDRYPGTLPRREVG